MTTKTIIKSVAGGVIALLALITFSTGCYTLDETEQAQVSMFGKFVGEPETEAGIHWRMPWLSSVTVQPKHTLEWDDSPVIVTTLNKTSVVVDGYALWRIIDLQQFILSTGGDIRRAESRFRDIINSATRNEIARHGVQSMIILDPSSPIFEAGVEPSADFIGNAAMEAKVIAESQPTFKTLGLELRAYHFKRVGYTEKVRQDIVKSMVSERESVAEKILSEGKEEAERIGGDKDKELRTLASGAQAEVRTKLGEAEAQVKNMYNVTFQQAGALAFYTNLQQIEAAAAALDSDGELILTTDSPLFSILKRIDLSQ